LFAKEPAPHVVVFYIHPEGISPENSIYSSASMDGTDIALPNLNANTHMNKNTLT
jgi:hypothetical protein